MDQLSIVGVQSNSSISPYTEGLSIANDEHLITLFLAHKTRNGQKSVKTVEAYSYDISEFISFINGYTGLSPFPLSNVTYHHCMAYLDWLNQSIVSNEQRSSTDTEPYITVPRYSPSTQHRRVKTIKALYTFGQKLGYFQRTPWLLVPTPSENPTGKNTNRLIPLEMIEKIQSTVADDPKDSAIISLFLSTGCRREELVNANWNDIQYHQTKDGSVLGWTIHGKGNKDRLVKIHPRVFEKLVKYRLSVGLPIEINKKDETPIFCPDGTTKRYSLSGINKKVKTIGIRSGIPELSPHWFRHTLATIALADQVDLYKVKEQLGHSSIVITERYLHMIDVLQDTAVDQIKRITF